MKYVDKEPFSSQKDQAHLVPIANPNFTLMEQPKAQLQATWLGHSSFYVQLHGKSFLTDPVLSSRASPLFFGDPKRLVPTPIQIKDLPQIDYVLISHNHYDHLDLQTIKQIGQGPTYLVPLGLKHWFINIGIQSEKIIEFDWWDTLSIEGIEITATPCQHWSARGLTDRNKSLWCSWHVASEALATKKTTPNLSFWFAGDTGYNDIQFKEIGETFKGIDLALIPIGAYAPRWFMKQQHINPEEAIQIHKDILARKSIGMHWGTFQLTAEPIMEPVERLKLAVQKGEIGAKEFLTLAIGETLTYP